MSDVASQTYPLSPMQAGMLFEALLYAGEGNPCFELGFNVEQLHVALPERLDANRLAEAFTTVARRHQSLSAAFEWEGLERPRQRFVANVTVPLEVVRLGRQDEFGVGASDFEAFLRADRERGFDIGRAPLMRLSVVQSERPGTDVVWTFHHILLDGRSFASVLLEVFEVYDSALRGGAASLRPAPRPYSEFLNWLEQRETAESLAYFAEVLEEKNRPTALPAAETEQRPLARTGYGEVVQRLDQAQLQSLRALAEHTQTTVATVIQAAWALVLSRFTQDEDVVFGTTRACRRSVPGREPTEMVGLFINTLPVRTNLSETLLVADLLQALRFQNLELRAHEHTPLSEIQSQLAGLRGRSLFNTVVIYENRELNATLRERGGEVWAGRHCTLHEQPSLPLTVSAFEVNGLEIRLLYDRRRFVDSSVERLTGCLITVALQMANNALRPLAELDVLTPLERDKILNEWNATNRPFPDQLCIHQLFEQRAQLHPDAIAVECNSHRLSYRELDAWANRLARVLQRRGVGRGQYVGVCLDRSLHLVCAVFAVAKSGAAYVPLDPDYPPARIAFMLDDAQAQWVITEERFRHLFIQQCVVVDGEHAREINTELATRPLCTAGSDDICYAIFTSGSTGNPKGVVLTHKAVLNTLDWVNRTFAVGLGDRLLFVTSPCFDLSVYDTFGALGAGATVVLATGSLLQDPQNLADALTELGITIWDSAPAALQRLVPFFPKPGSQPTLRLAMLSGDWIPLSLPEAIRSAFRGANVCSLGGATEAAIWSNWYPIRELDPRWTSVPYGRPIQNSRYHVLDAYLRPVPVGVPGDLYIGGVCLAEGYLNRPQLTAERFITDPLSGVVGQRLYRTGDLARYFEDGNLEFLGRADFQVKIRGFRVEIGEVEAALKRIAGITEAVCATFVDASGQRSLVAYIVLETGQNIGESSVKRALGASLPDFMVPSQIVQLRTIPLSSNGKVDRRALPLPDGGAHQSRPMGPRNDTERVLQAVWQRVLRRDAIGVQDNFFELGGHSLLAVVLVSELRRELNVEIPLSRIISCPTIESLAQALRGAGSAANEPDASAPLIQALHLGGPKAFYFVHDGDGEILLYRTLAAMLPPSFSAFGITPLAAPRIPMAQRTVQEIAACYVRQVLARQPGGSYYLGGLCAGGVIAFEMGRQLAAAGATVELVAIMDAVEPSAPQKRFRVTRDRLARIRSMWGRRSMQSSIPPSLAHVGGGRRPLALGRVAWRVAQKAAGTLRYEAVSRVAAMSVSLRVALLREVLKRSWSWPTVVPSLSVREIYLAARARYVPQRAKIRQVALLKATDGYGDDEPVARLSDDPLLGWGPVVAGELQAVEVPGGHSSMLQEPYVRGVARVLEGFLDRTASEGESPLSRHWRSSNPSAPHTSRGSRSSHPPHNGPPPLAAIPRAAALPSLDPAELLASDIEPPSTVRSPK